MNYGFLVFNFVVKGDIFKIIVFKELNLNGVILIVKVFLIMVGD